MAEHDLAALLDRVFDRVQASDTEGWDQRRPTHEIAASFADLLARVRVGDVDRDAFRLMFAPTGELQELSMANGWADEFITLSSQVDALLGDYNQ